MMFGGWTGLTEHERAVTYATDAAVGALLSTGHSVICDDTYLPQQRARGARRMAERHGATFKVVDFTDVPLDVCIARDAERIEQGERGVGAEVITDMYNRFLRGRTYPLPFPEEPEAAIPAPDLYVPNFTLPPAVIVDLDGTVALNTGGRSPYDESRVKEDTPNEAVVKTVQALHSGGYNILFVSGRHDTCYDDTCDWLNENVYLNDYELFMREEGDNRKDSIIKREIFDAKIRHNYNVMGCIDDRQQVVDAYRAMGLTVFQCAPGDF
jgi:hypothetical protein